jgi:hypothetical protein
MKVNQVGQQKRMLTRSGGEPIYFVITLNHGTNYNCHNVCFQLYNCSTIGQLHVSKGSIFVENDLLFQKINMVEPIIHVCLFCFALIMIQKTSVW